jgi:hypothetical protein
MLITITAFYIVFVFQTVDIAPCLPGKFTATALMTQFPFSIKTVTGSITQRFNPHILHPSYRDDPRVSTERF